MKSRSTFLPSGSLLIGAVLSLLLQACASLPSLAGRSTSQALQDTSDTALGRVIVPMSQAHPGLSGVFALSSGRNAFAARVRLADAAERSLDVQYYIWHKDMSGILLLEALRRAADRGVRVRLLLDDSNTQEIEDTLSELDAHPNIEVRLFNPFVERRSRDLGYLLDFARLDRRMHNKSFTADNQATIVGGRNVGDEYFDTGDDPLFVDLDVLAVGPVVDRVSQAFDRYWASDSSYPSRLFLKEVSSPMASALHAAARRVEEDPASSAYMAAIAGSPFVGDLMAHRLPLEWAEVTLLSDDPAKVFGLAGEQDEVFDQVKRVLHGARKRVTLVSPYFVPGDQGVDALASMARSGVKIEVLTNSLAATDVPAVHAGYAKRRKPLLVAGVRLFELEPSVRPRRVPRSQGSIGAAGQSLHAKTFTVDDEHVFVGSFNFDPRSARLNTEMGFVISSPALARTIATGLNEVTESHSYRLRLNTAGDIEWVERLPGGNDLVYDHEPGVGLWERLGVDLLSILPIESQL